MRIANQRECNSLNCCIDLNQLLLNDIDRELRTGAKFAMYDCLVGDGGEVNECVAVKDKPQRIFAMGCRRTDDCIQGHTTRHVCSQLFQNCPRVSSVSGF